MTGIALLSGCGGDGGTSSLTPPPTNVGPPDATTLVITPSSLTLNTLIVTQYQVTMSNGVRPTEAIVSKSSNERVVFATHDTLQGRAPGSATVTVTAGARSGTFVVNVPADVALGAFLAPLDSVPSIVNVFDHDKPHEFTDNNGYLLSYWGEKTTGIDGHNGYDWLVNEGTPVRAVADGTVLSAGPETPGPCPVLGNQIVSGLWVEIGHATTPNELILSQYGHFSRIDVKVGDRVKAGQQIGLSGTTGCSTGPHLHFSAWRMLGNESVPRAYDRLAFRVMDPFGWTASTMDPWMLDSTGMESLLLWTGAKAPTIYKSAGMPGGAAVLPFSVRYWVPDRHQQYVEVGTPGSVPVDISGWTIENTAGVKYTFPANTVVNATRRFRVYTGGGTNNGTDLYWNASAPVWGISGDCVTIRKLDASVEYSQPYGVGSCGGISITASQMPALPLDAPLSNRPPRLR